MTEQNTLELLPCPFCGGSDLRHFVGSKFLSDAVVCSCGAEVEGPPDRWNTRAPAALAVPEVAALVEAATALITATVSAHNTLWDVINERRECPIETPDLPVEVIRMQTALAALKGGDA